MFINFTLSFLEESVIYEKREYYGNGELFSVTRFENGTRNGIEVKYYNTGEKWIETNYENVIIDGIQTKFRKSGQVYELNIFKNGELEVKKTLNFWN